MLRQLYAIADGLTGHAISKVKQSAHRLLMAGVTLALGVACLVAGLAYLASSLWHALVPAVGTVGADLILGTVYALVATALLVGGSRLAR